MRATTEKEDEVSAAAVIRRRASSRMLMLWGLPRARRGWRRPNPWKQVGRPLGSEHEIGPGCGGSEVAVDEGSARGGRSSRQEHGDDQRTRRTYYQRVRDTFHRLPRYTSLQSEQSRSWCSPQH